MKFQEDPQFWSNLRTCVIWCCLLSEWEMVHSSVLKRKGVEQQFLCWKYRALPYKICPDRPWGPPSLLLYNGYRVTPEGKAVGAWRWPSSAEVKRRIELHLYSPSGPSWPVLEWTFFFFTKYNRADDQAFRICISLDRADFARSANFRT